MLAEIKMFVKWARRRNPEARTWRDYSYDLKQFAELVGERPLGEVTFREIDAFVAWQVSRGFKPNTVNRRLAAIASLYLFWSAEMPELICRVLPRRHNLREPQSLPRPVPPDDLLKFFRVIETVRDLAMFLLMLRSGLRIAEVAGLRVPDLYLEQTPPRLVVRGKGLIERAVYLSPFTEAALRAYPTGSGGGEAARL
jgi:site-specific recombinase XerD